MAFEITAKAAKFIGKMIKMDGGPGAGFHLAVKPGGCSGLSADIGVTAAPAAGESVVEANGLKLFVNAESRILLEGVTIDFEDTAAKTGLVFFDPKATGSCSSH